MAKKISKMSSEGGKARAKKLTSTQRSEIARNAVQARWKKAGKPGVLRATHGSLDHPLVIGEIELPCYVLEDGTRVFSQRGLQGGLAMGVRGGALRMTKFADDIALSTSKHSDLAARFKNPIRFVSPGGQALGYEATILVDLCDAILEARTNGDLRAGLKPVADRCEIFVRAFAKVGIIALVDEATGYQYERQRDALEQLLEDILSDELRRWVRTFPPAYFRELCRLRNIAFRGDMRLPQYFGHLTNDMVYKRLVPRVLKELQERNPAKNGHRKSAHHQWLSEDVGHPRLIQHLGTVIGLMKISDNWNTFKKWLDKAAPVYEDLPLLNGLDDDS